MNVIWSWCDQITQKWKWKFEHDVACFVFVWYFVGNMICLCGGIFSSYWMNIPLGFSLFVAEIIAIMSTVIDAIMEQRPYADIFKIDHWYQSPRKLESILDVWVAYENYKWIIRDLKSGQEIVTGNPTNHPNEVKKCIDVLHFQHIALYMNCAHEFSHESLFHKDYLPRDMLRLILGYVHKEIHLSYVDKSITKRE